MRLRCTITGIINTKPEYYPDNWTIKDVLEVEQKNIERCPEDVLLYMSDMKCNVEIEEDEPEFNPAP